MDDVDVSLTYNDPCYALASQPRLYKHSRLSSMWPIKLPGDTIRQQVMRVFATGFSWAEVQR